MDKKRPWMNDLDSQGDRKHAPAVKRNREAIAEILQEWLPDEGLVLEIASGTGEHAAYFARRFSGLVWQPSDPDPVAIRSIEAWRDHVSPANLKPALTLDAQSQKWPVDAADALICINMTHISPWQATLGLLAGAKRLLRSGSPVILYGPFREAGVQLRESNAAFDASLKARDARWGLREVEEIAGAAEAEGLVLRQRAEMPANNLMLLFRRI